MAIGSPFLKGGLEERNNPLKQLGRGLLRDPGPLMNVPGNIGLSHWVSFSLRQEAFLLKFLNLLFNQFQHEVFQGFVLSCRRHFEAK
jgi:hypothetical protein